VDTARIVREIDSEIARLNSARNILRGTNSTSHPKEQTTRTSPARRTAKAKSAHRLSVAGRRRLSELMKKRWAERRKKTAAKTK